MKNSIKLSLSLLAFVLLGCDSSFVSSTLNGNKVGASSENDADNLDAGITNQAPKISCLLVDMSQPLLQRRIDTIGEKDTFFSSYPVEGETLSFDCSDTQDEAPSNLSFFVDTDYDPANPDWQPLSGSIQLVAGRKSMAIKALDSDGLQTIKTFAIDSQCANGEAPVIDPNAVTIVATAKHNYYNFSADGAVTGGSDFQYAWDFNGDSVFDAFPVNPNAGSIWINNPTANNVYSLFASSGSQIRKAFLRVRNGCNLESDTVEVNMPQELLNIARTSEAQAVKKPYYYLQADISGLGNQPTALSLNQRSNGAFLATKYPDDQYRRVTCSYDFKSIADKARFTIRGVNWYQGSTQANLDDDFLHGMEVKINNIPDNGGTSTQTYSQSDGVKLDSALYKTSAESDGLVDENYDRINTACTVEITIERAQTLSPCSTNTDQVEFEPTSATILLGEFNCPSLTNRSTGLSVAANNGKFYCEVAPQDQCVGGGGGGGGTPPREE